MKKAAICLSLALLFSSCVVSPIEKKRGVADNAVVQTYPEGLVTGLFGPLALPLWETFVERPEIKDFDRILAKNWETNFDLFSDVLVHKSKAISLNHMSLRKILKIIKAEKRRGAMVPIGAYSTTYDGNPTWVVVVKWGSSGKPVYTDLNNNGTMSEGWPVLCHTCVFLYDSNTFELKGFTSCL